MHVIVDNEPLVPERTAKACDFTDRLRQLTHDVRLIELAVASALDDGNDENRAAIVLHCRKLEADIDELADMVLPEMSDEDKAAIAAALNGGRP